MLITISISSAPALTAWEHSNALTSVGDAPKGNPITVQILTFVPDKTSFAKGIQQGFIQTAIKLCFFAYSRTVRTLSSEVSCLRIVWSIYCEISSGFFLSLLL